MSKSKQPLHLLIIISVYCIGSVSLANAQSDPTSLSLGGAVTALSPGPYAALWQPAALRSCDTAAEPEKIIQIGIGIDKPLPLAGFVRGVCSGRMTFGKQQAFGLQLQTQHFGDYQELGLGIGYCITLLNRVNVGIQARYLQIGIAGYGTAGAVLIDGGIQARIANQFYWGARIMNASQSKLKGNTNEMLPILLSTGVRYQPGEQVFITVEAENTAWAAHAVNWKAGISYRPVVPLRLHIGFSSAPVSLATGISFAYRGVELSVAFRWIDRMTTQPLSGIALTDIKY
jgi:hypothetical protein